MIDRSPIIFFKRAELKVSGFLLYSLCATRERKRCAISFKSEKSYVAVVIWCKSNESKKSRYISPRKKDMHEYNSSFSRNCLRQTYATNRYYIIFWIPVAENSNCNKLIWHYIYYYNDFLIFLVQLVRWILLWDNIFSQSLSNIQ